MLKKDKWTIFGKLITQNKDKDKCEKGDFFNNVIKRILSGRKNRTFLKGDNNNTDAKHVHKERVFCSFAFRGKTFACARTWTIVLWNPTARERVKQDRCVCVCVKTIYLIVIIKIVLFLLPKELCWKYVNFLNFRVIFEFETPSRTFEKGQLFEFFLRQAKLKITLLLMGHDQINPYTAQIRKTEVPALTGLAWFGLATH